MCDQCSPDFSCWSDRAQCRKRHPGSVATLERRIDELERENAKLRERFSDQINYSVALCRAVEHHVRGAKVPEAIAKDCPYHAELLNR